MQTLWHCYWEHERSADAALLRILDEHLARRQQESAEAIAACFVRRDPDPAARARRLLMLGVALERRKRFELAEASYQQGLRLEPTDDEVCYGLNSNLGHSLNQLGRFAEAEPFCRSAIACDPLRHDAHEHLGVALAGQGQHLEAARSFITAIRACPCEPRAFRHLESLAKSHGASVAIGIPDIAAVVSQFRDLVYAARVVRTSG